ncbi:MAG TPA: hypothetical protein VNW30_02975 [Opitutaceae bacterium]|nr:hypothetical protein [Opitutaceae bacterium]
MTRTVRVALWALRIYLLVLLALIGLKFVRTFASPGNANPPAASTPAPKSAP